MDYILAAENIQKKYHGDFVLRDVSIHVKQGEIYGLIGKNGSGKTTLLRILTGLIKEYSGTVFIGRVSHISKVGAVINDPALFLNMNAVDNLKHQACLLGIRDVRKIETALKTVGLAHSKSKLVKHYSVGMTQRLKLAMALLESPDILILDEPMNGLDPNGIVDLRELLLSLNHTDGITIIISSHILSELEQTATCFGILHNGEIVKELYTQDVIREGKHLEELYMQYAREVHGHAKDMEK
jgi:ABC-type multidrug transport system ATPase subunit